MTQHLKLKPFPWKCGHCRSRTVNPAVIDYSTDFEHDGRAHKVTVTGLEVQQCGNCGEIVLDDNANRRISAAFRTQLGLLSPEEIRKNRETLGLTQKQLATVLGIAEATLSRWETGGQIQQRSLDRLLRLFFGSAAVRDVLSDEARLARLSSDVPEIAASSSEANPYWLSMDQELTQKIKEWMSNLSDDLRKRLQNPQEKGDVPILEERQREVAAFMVPLFVWSTQVNDASLRYFTDCVRNELCTAPSANWRDATVKTDRSQRSQRWLVAPLQARSGHDCERAGRISRFADLIDQIPDDKEETALNHLTQFVKVFLARSDDAPSTTLGREQRSVLVD